MFLGRSLEFPESVLAKGRKGKLEIRGLDHRGSYVMCKYLDSKTISLLTPNEN
jgi:hypothetical protein